LGGPSFRWDDGALGLLEEIPAFAGIKTTNVFEQALLNERRKW